MPRIIKAYVRTWDQRVDGRDQLPHELAHSWNGKYRRPARLWTPHFNTPMQDDLLWVYEGLTQYYGYVIAARSGLWPAEFAREELALVAATFDRRRPGREWRTLEDTTYMPVINSRRHRPGQRREGASRVPGVTDTPVERARPGHRSQRLPG